MVNIMRRVMRVVECSDHDVLYGFLEVYNTTEEEVQQKIYEIKNRFYKEGFEDWTIDDVFEQFPTEWKWTFLQDDGYVLEI